MSAKRIIGWIARVAIALIWTLTAADLFPPFSGLVDCEVWLTNRFADPLLFVFASGMLLMTLLSSSLWAEMADIVTRISPLMAKFLAMQFSHAETEVPARRQPDPEHFTPKLVVSQIVETHPAETVDGTKQTASDPIILDPQPAAERNKLFEGIVETEVKPSGATASKPQSSLDLIMPNQVVQLAADFARWDKAHSLKTWQVAWLWNEWEPVSDNLKGKPCLPTCLRLEAHIEAGALPASRGAEEAVRYADIRRQDLVDYALALNERPKFLFVEERSWLTRKLREWRQREVPADEAENFASYSETKLVLYKILQIINTDAVALEIKTAMRKGGCEGIARRQVGSITYGFERIPRHLWRGLTIDWLGNVTGRSVVYTDLRVRFRPDYYQVPAATAPAASAIDGDLSEDLAAAARSHA